MAVQKKPTNPKRTTNSRKTTVPVKSTKTTKRPQTVRPIKQNSKKKKKKSLTKEQKRVIRGSIQIILLSAIICIITFVFYIAAKYAVKPSDALLVEEGKISETENVEGYIIRDERVVNSQNLDTGLIEIKSDGEKVSKNEKIFRYKTSNEAEITAQIESLNNQIQEAISGQSNLLSSDIMALDAQIDKISAKTMNTNNLQTIAENKKDISNYMSKKAKIAGDASPATSYINGLIAQKTELENQLTAGSNYEISPISGVVSYRVDGLEGELTPSKIPELTSAYLENLGIKSSQAVSKNSSRGKVINSFACYIAISRKADSDNKVKAGDKINIKIPSDKVVRATVESVKNEGEKDLIILKITQGVEDLIKYRKANFEIIWWEKEGLKVPRSAIIYENGRSYVVRNRAGSKTKILVKILRENENYSIIGTYSVEEMKELGFSATDISNMRKINIYDEILVNPQVKDIQSNI